MFRSKVQQESVAIRDSGRSTDIPEILSLSYFNDSLRVLHPETIKISPVPFRAIVFKLQTASHWCGRFQSAC